MKIPEPKKMSGGGWRIQLRLNGVSIPVTAPTRKECIRAAELIKAEYKNGKRAVRERTGKTLDQAIGEYINARRNVLSPATARGYQTIRRTRFKALMDRDIASITEDEWQRAINNEAKLCSAKTIENAWGLVTPTLRVNKLPVPEVTLPQVISAERPWLEPEQTFVFIDAVKGKSFAIPALLALHGLRRSEIYGLTWDNIDLNKNLIRISGAVVMDENNNPVHKLENKNRTSARTIPIMIPELRTALAAVEDKTGNLVKTHIHTLYKQVNRTCRAAGLPEVGVHGLRHSFASVCYHVKLTERETMELGGWNDYQTVHKIYTHLARADRLKAQNKVAEFFGANV